MRKPFPSKSEQWKTNFEFSYVIVISKRRETKIRFLTVDPTVDDDQPPVRKP
jgi:hypothetical protein